LKVSKSRIKQINFEDFLTVETLMKEKFYREKLKTLLKGGINEKA